jgi:hypothetical protein
MTETEGRTNHWMKTPNTPLAALLALLLATTVRADQYRIEIHAQTSSLSTASGTWGDSIVIGTPLALTLTVDSSLGTPFDTYSRCYEATDGSLTVGSFQMQMAANFFVYDNDPINGDSFGMEEMPPTANNRFPYSGFSAWLGSSDLSLLNDLSVPSQAIDLSKFDALWLGVWGANEDTYGTTEMSRLNATITGYSVTAIPEPATTALWMGAAALATLTVLRQKRR